MVLSKLHQTIKKVTEDIQVYKYNTAISAIMELVNLLYDKGLDIEVKKNLVLLLAPFAPHTTEEVWQNMKEGEGDKFESIHFHHWPKWDPKLIKVGKVTIVIQVNGKLRGQIQMKAESSKNKEEVEKLAREDQKISKYILGKQIKKTVFVEGKLINFVTNSS